MQASGSAPGSNRLTTFILIGLLLGVAVGYACNRLAASAASPAQSVGVPRTEVVQDSGPCRHALFEFNWETIQ